MSEKRNPVIIGGGFLIAFVVLALGIYSVLNAIDSNRAQQAEVESVSSSGTAHNMDTNNTIASSDGKSVIEPPQKIPEFTLTAQDGEPLSLSNLNGRYVLLSFGYTHCPDVCPATLLEFRQIHRQLGDLSEQVEFMFISVDPARDTPELLNRYMARYDPSFIGLSGDEDVLQSIAPDFGLFWDIRDDTSTRAGYIVDHTASRYLLDPEGQLIRIYSFTADPLVIEADIRDLLTSN